MPDFWRRSGYHLLDRDRAGHLAVSDDFLRAYLDRPELRPVPGSCPAELALHCSLVEDPRAAITDWRLDQVADPDARENYRIVLRLRDLLLRHDSIEAAYLAAVREGPPLPPLFLDQMTQVILRDILDGCADPLRVRAAELLFRSQTVTLTDGAILMADEETVEMRAAAGDLSADTLLDANQVPRAVAVDVLGKDNEHSYWERSDRFDTAFDASFDRFGLDALARVLEAWVRRLLGSGVSIQPVASIRDERWRWHIGLDAEATAILNDLYLGNPVDEGRLYRLLALFRLELEAGTPVLAELKGRPVYLGMAMTEAGRLRLKPQNLLVNLPLAASG